MKEGKGARGGGGGEEGRGEWDKEREGGREGAKIIEYQ